MLEQKLATSTQQQDLFKLMGYDFTVQYKRGKENVCADSLSWVHEVPPATLNSLITLQPDTM
ncbi:hypothetical protein KSP39_PZI023724 [Platanthera zijinensis]|uniref:Uncharacterized protein n=1 Tax=Platanthera zijinensis TaxID=2320716 RepID=A0AAP0ATV1_9ASPA